LKGISFVHLLANCAFIHGIVSFAGGCQTGCA
jgi:hypothetical protein